jgi:spore maturation protein CgeB
MGTYSDDRQPTLDRLLVEPARPGRPGASWWRGRCIPESIAWPPNVTRITHLAPREHRAFYTAQRFTLNVTRADMIAAGWSPSVRLFEAAACGVPIVSDWWDGLDAVLTPGTEILVARSADDVLGALRDLPDDERRALGLAARRRVLAAHTAAHRAAELEGYVAEVLAAHAAPPLRNVP